MLRVISRHHRIPIAVGLHPFFVLVIIRIDTWPHLDCIKSQRVLLIRLRSDDPDLSVHELAQQGWPQGRPQGQSRLLLPSSISYGLAVQQCIVNVSQGEGHLIVVEPVRIRG